MSASLNPDAFLTEIHFSLGITFLLPNADLCFSRLNMVGEYPTGGSHGYSSPVCLYCPKPQSPEEAVKAKLQGRARLTAILTPEGRAADTRVVQGLDLDFDEKVVEVVHTWRLKPALGPDRRPVAVRQIMECDFHLY
jgi:TonB family protein